MSLGNFERLCLLPVSPQGRLLAEMQLCHSNTRHSPVEEPSWSPYGQTLAPRSPAFQATVLQGGPTWLPELGGQEGVP